MRIPVIATLGATLALVPALHSNSQARQDPTDVPQRAVAFVAIYERGPAWDTAKSALEQRRIQDHMMYLRANLDKLVGAAPFQQGLAAGSTDRTVGMVILAAASEEEAQRFIAGDPAIAAGVMKSTLRRWLVDRVKAF